MKNFTFKKHILEELLKSRVYISTFINILFEEDKLYDWKISIHLLDWQESLYKILEWNDDTYMAYHVKDEATKKKLERYYAKLVKKYSKFPYHEPLLHESHLKNVLLAINYTEQKQIIVSLQKQEGSNDYVYISNTPRPEADIYTFNGAELFFHLTWNQLPDEKFEKVIRVFIRAKDERAIEECKKDIKLLYNTE